MFHRVNKDELELLLYCLSSLSNIEDNLTLPELGEREMFVPIRNSLFNDILIDLIHFVFLCNTITNVCLDLFDDVTMKKFFPTSVN